MNNFLKYKIKYLALNQNGGANNELTQTYGTKFTQRYADCKFDYSTCNTHPHCSTLEEDGKKYCLPKEILPGFLSSLYDPNKEQREKLKKEYNEYSELNKCNVPIDKCLTKPGCSVINENGMDYCIPEDSLAPSGLMGYFKADSQKDRRNKLKSYYLEKKNITDAKVHLRQQLQRIRAEIFNIIKNLRIGDIIYFKDASNATVKSINDGDIILDYEAFGSMTELKMSDIMRGRLLDMIDYFERPQTNVSSLAVSNNIRELSDSSRMPMVLQDESTPKSSKLNSKDELIQKLLAQGKLRPTELLISS